MIKSMTGYGRATASVDGKEITVEVRSVNNRYFDCNIKIPRMYAFAEDGIKQKVKKTITRGKVDVYICIYSVAAEGVNISLNRPMVEAYLSAMGTMVKDYGVKDDISATSLARFPDVFVVEKPEDDEEKIKNEILSVVDSAIVQYDAMRVTEGQALEADISMRAEHILGLTAQVEKKSPVTLAEYRERLSNKMREVLENNNVDESRLLTEVAIYADKIAVDEETVRLRSHLSQMENLIKTGGAIGRKLDFLLQELNREANTIGSKSNDVEQARTVVDMKAELEKIREQTQNIE